MEINIGLIGIGTVGRGVAELLEQNKNFFRNQLGIKFQLHTVCAKEQQMLDEFPFETKFKTTDALEVCRNKDIHIVVELAGGYDLPKQWLSEAFRHGKHAVTANKAMLAQYGPDLFPLAEKNNCALLFEAAVGGGIPIIRTLQESLIANDIIGIACIINGTCNYILSEMTQKGTDFDTALKNAQEKGYAEADPTFDVNGTDSAHKVALLASMCYGKYVDFNEMAVEGITSILPLDISMAEEMGYVLRLLGTVSQNKDGRIQAGVHPALVEKDHQLAAVSGVLNAVYLRTSGIGPLLLTGAGAGRYPTASAVVGDIISIARQMCNDGSPQPVPMGFLSRENPAKLVQPEEIEAKYYLRLIGVDEPGVLAQVTRILGEKKISISSILQKPEHHPQYVPIIILTHTCKGKDILEAVKQLAGLEVIQEPPQLIPFYE